MQANKRPWSSSAPYQTQYAVRQNNNTGQLNATSAARPLSQYTLHGAAPQRRTTSRLQGMTLETRQ